MKIFRVRPAHGRSHAPARLFAASLTAGFLLGGPLVMSARASEPKAEAVKPNPQVGEENQPMSDVDPAIARARAYIEEQQIDRSQARWRTSLPKFPELNFTEGSTYYWNLETNVGEMRIRFMPEVAPHHVANFIYLTELGFFDGLTFHRVIQGFMAQGGCPLGNGTGSPGYRFQGEFDPAVQHDRAGLLSMANAGPGTDGSQFFITFKATPWLDGKHTLFGETVEGKETLRELEAHGSAEASGRPSKPLRIERATITVE